jgi:hypothetical protein
MALTSPTSGGRSVGIVRLRTTALEFSFSLIHYINPNTDLFGKVTFNGLPYAVNVNGKQSKINPN